MRQLTQQELLYGGAVLAIGVAGYWYYRKQHQVPTAINADLQSATSGPGYPFVTGGGSGGSSGGLITCPDGTIVTDVSMCTSAGSGSGPGGGGSGGSGCGSAGQACCAGSACNSGLVCTSNLCQADTASHKCTSTPVLCDTTNGVPAGTCTCTDSKSTKLTHIKVTATYCKAITYAAKPVDYCSYLCSTYPLCASSSSAAQSHVASVVTPFGARSS